MKKLALLLALLMAVSVVPAFAAEEAQKDAKAEVAVVEKDAKAEVVVAEDAAVVATEDAAVNKAAEINKSALYAEHNKIINYKTAIKVYRHGTYTWGNITKLDVDAPENRSIATRGTVVAGYSIDMAASFLLSKVDFEASPNGDIKISANGDYEVIAVPYTKETKGTAVYTDYENGRVIRIPVSYVETNAEAGSGVAYVRFPRFLATPDDHSCPIARLIFVETDKPVHDITFNFLQYMGN